MNEAASTEIAHVEADEFAALEGSGKAEEKQGPVPSAAQGQRAWPPWRGSRASRQASSPPGPSPWRGGYRSSRGAQPDPPSVCLGQRPYGFGRWP